ASPSLSLSARGPLPHLSAVPTRRSSDLAAMGGESGCRARLGTRARRRSALVRLRAAAAVARIFLAAGGEYRASDDVEPVHFVVVRKRDYRARAAASRECGSQDRKSTRLNSSHRTISYAVFCLKK